MRIFVAGATGVLGVRVVPLLVGAGQDVTAIGRTAEKTLSRSLRISSRKLGLATGWSPRYRTTLEGFEAVVSGNRR